MKTVGRVWTWMLMRGLREATHSEFQGAQHTSLPAHRQSPTRHVTNSPHQRKSEKGLATIRVLQ